MNERDKVQFVGCNSDSVLHQIAATRIRRKTLSLLRPTYSMNLCVLRVNSQTDSGENVMAANRSSNQSETAIQNLDNYAQIAMGNHNDNPQRVSVLSKSRYLNCVDRLDNTLNGADFLGGTTVAGWRAGVNQWAFYYQVWGNLREGGVQLIHSEEFYKNY